MYEQKVLELTIKNIIIIANVEIKVGDCSYNTNVPSGLKNNFQLLWVNRFYCVRVCFKFIVLYKIYLGTHFCFKRPSFDLFVNIFVCFLRK